ncbi:transketolase [Candidatus Magnetomoraceae bacterium gMMP-15]
MIPVCKQIRKDMLYIAKQSGHGHLPTCFSIVEILYAIYSVMKHDPQNLLLKDRDIFILSKGHGSLSLYCILGEFGYFNKEKIFSFGSFMSDFGCHADRFKIPGIEASTGSLGHGIGIAVGVALAFKIEKSHRKVFVVIGDGESNEGTVWESIMVAVNLNLNNLIIVYDNNMSHARGLQINNPAQRFQAFGCDVQEVNGHDINELKEAFSKKSPLVKIIVANTKKGAGCKTLTENQYEWHRKSPDDIELKKLLEELDAQAV